MRGFWGFRCRLCKNWSLTFPNLNLIIRGLPLFLPVARQELLHWPWAFTGVLEENSITVNRYTGFRRGHKQTEGQLHRPVEQTLKQDASLHGFASFTTQTSKFPEKHSKHEMESLIPNSKLCGVFFIEWWFKVYDLEIPVETLKANTVYNESYVKVTV